MKYGFGLSMTMQRPAAGGGGATMRQQVEGLRDQTTINGARAGTYKVPGVDAMPTGMTYNAGTGTATIGSTFSGDLTFWDFTGKALTVQGPINEIRDCKFGEPLGAPAGKLYYIDLYVAGSIDTIDYCTFEGPYTYNGTGTAINARSTGTGISFTPGNIRWMHHNRFVGLSADHTKLNGCAAAGGQIIEWNYYGATVNLPNDPPDYSAGATYALGYAVRKTSNGFVYISLTAGNIGNPLPTGASKTDATAFWQGVDPHADHITTVASIGDGITIRHNLFDNTDNPPGPLGPYPAIGINNAVRISRNTGTDYLLNKVDVTENVIYRGNALASYPIQVSQGVETNFNGPIHFSGNWIGANASASYWHPTGNGWTDVWSNNRDYATDALITGPTLRVRNVVVAYLSQSEPVYVTETGGPYQIMTAPALEAENFILYQRNGAGTGAAATTTKTTLTSANYTTVNPSMVVLANALNYIAPTRDFVLAELGEAGTGRLEWVDDANTGRIWARSADIITEVLADYGRIDRVGEFWYANDASAMPSWLANMAAVYYGQNPDGTAFTLGSTRSTATTNVTAVVDHCIYDFQEANPALRGRGLFARNTPLDISRKGPWVGDSAGRWSGMQAFADDSRFVALGGKYGPPANAWYSDGHPIASSGAGQYEAAFDFLMPTMLRAAGLSANESAFTSITVAGDNSYLDVVFTPGNGGTLSTKRIVQGIADPASPPYYWHKVVGFEVLRNGESDRFLICRPGSAGIATKYQGTVVLQSATSVRITPVVPFAAGDIITYMWGPSFCRSDAGYTYPDLQYVPEMATLDMAIEYVAAYTNPAGAYKFSGFPVRTYSSSFVVASTAPSTFFTMGATGPYFQDPVNVPANTTRIRWKFQIKVPAAVASVSGGRNIFTQESNGFDLLLTTNAGATTIYIGKIEDGIFATVTPASVDLISGSRDIWYEIEIYADQVSKEAVFSINGAAPVTRAFTGAGNGVFQTGREISMCGSTAGTVLLHEGVQMAYIECYMTTSGAETLRKRIAGNAATVNADAWKLGGNAT